MIRKGFYALQAAVFFASFFLGCVSKEQPDFPRAVIIVGEVTLIRKGESALLEQNQYLRPGDTIRVKDNAKVKFEVAAEAWWYLNRGSELAVIDQVPLSEVKKRLSVSLLSGQLHIVKRAESNCEYQIATAPWIVRVTAADVSIDADRDHAACGVKLLAGFATFTPTGGTETVIPPCNRLRPGRNGPAALEALRFEDIASVKGWVGSTVVEEALIRSGCIVSKQAAMNEPPIWQRLPRESAALGETFADTVEAVDPEQSEITYSLYEAPAGMTLEARTGIIRYTAGVAGEHHMTIVASDAKALSCTARVVLNVSADLSLRMIAPRMVQPGRPFSVAAVPQGNGKKRVNFRFDLNGDGKFDFPSNGKFGPISIVKRHIFVDEGVFQLHAEARLDDGQTASVRRLITVNAPPAAVLKVTPGVVPVGDPVELDVSASYDTRNGNIPLKVRYDIDGNGKWDLPEDNQFLATTMATYAWEKTGVYTVIAELMDKDGASSIASARVVVSRGVSGGSIECRDTVHAGDSLKVTCIAPIMEFPVKEFAWSFDGDTIYEKKGAQAVAYVRLRKAGMVKILCRITDEKGQQGTIVRNVMVINSAARVDAGGPYRVGVNKPVELAGTGSDPDSRIVGYSWDMEGDGNIDWNSKTATKAAFTYKKAGTFSAIFCVETDDGLKVCDTARVEVINTPPKVSAGDDIVSRKNRKIKLSGTAVDEDGKIVLYAWDFDGDGTMDWTSKESGITERIFTSYASAVFRAYDSCGDSAADTVRIVICPDGMRTIEDGKFCIDEYEYPNQRNAKPQTDVSYEEASNLCRNAGKRLCTAAEWESACRDVNKNYDYPYGINYDPGRCNTLGNPRVKNSIAPSGDFFECRNSAGVFDMSGNAAEWVESVNGDFFVYGGSWQNGREGSHCSSRVQLRKGMKYFYAGFRCCK